MSVGKSAVCVVVCVHVCVVVCVCVCVRACVRVYVSTSLPSHKVIPMSLQRNKDCFNRSRNSKAWLLECSINN